MERHVPGRRQRESRLHRFAAIEVQHVAAIECANSRARTLGGITLDNLLRTSLACPTRHRDARRNQGGRVIRIPPRHQLRIIRRQEGGSQPGAFRHPLTVCIGLGFHDGNCLPDIARLHRVGVARRTGNVCTCQPPLPGSSDRTRRQIVNPKPGLGQKCLPVLDRTADGGRNQIYRPADQRSRVHLVGPRKDRGAGDRDIDLAGFRIDDQRVLGFGRDRQLRLDDRDIDLPLAFLSQIIRCRINHGVKTRDAGRRCIGNRVVRLHDRRTKRSVRRDDRERLAFGIIIIRKHINGDGSAIHDYDQRVIPNHRSLVPGG